LLKAGFAKFSRLDIFCSAGGYDFSEVSFLRNKRLKILLLVLALVCAAFLSSCSWRQSFDVQLPAGGGSINAAAVMSDVVQAADTMRAENYDYYATYFTPDEYSLFLDDLLGNYCGIGVYIYDNQDSGHVTVLSVMKNSPAQEAGLHPGDEFLSLDGKDVRDMDSTVLSTILKGESGKKITLTMWRPDSGEFTVSLTRRDIEIPTVEGELLDKVNKIGYIQIIAFTSSTAASFDEALSALQVQGMKYLIIDLRDNGGGDVGQALQVADHFVPEGKVLLRLKEKMGESEYIASKTYLSIPLVMLQNENSASASEMLLCSVHDNQGATTVGVQSFGKGIMQTISPLDNGGGLRITTAEYFSPTGGVVHKVGLKPDIACPLDKDTPHTVIYTRDPAKDPQLKAAIDTLFAQ